MRPIYFFSLLFIFCASASVGSAQNQPDRQQIQQQIQEQRRLQAERNQNRQTSSAAEVQEQPQQPVRQQNPDPVRRTTRQRPSDAAVSDKTPALTERAKIKNLDNSRVPTHTVWLREIIKMVDLDKGDNAALKYPAQPMGDRVNLFTLLFQLMRDNRIDIYGYISDRDPVFSEDTKISVEEVLKKSLIPYTMEGTGDNVRFIVNDSDIPSRDVSKYLLKEDWFFDEATGTFNSQVTAICPVMIRIDYNDNTTETTPICWIPYENIRPYLSRMLIMTSDYNNALTYTIDDYFMKKMYSGDIVKTMNMRNETLAEQVGAEPEALKHAQDSIENQLATFRKQLWVQPDTTTVASAGKKEKKAAASVSRGKGSSAAKAEDKKQPKPKAEKSSAAPTKSVRRTR